MSASEGRKFAAFIDYPEHDVATIPTSKLDPVSGSHLVVVDPNCRRALMIQGARWLHVCNLTRRGAERLKLEEKMSL